VRKDGADYEVCRVSMGGVMKLRIALMLMVVLSGAPVAIRAQTPEPPPPLDLVTLKDGSQIYGDVIEMDNGELKIKIAFGVGNFITVKWDNVAKRSITRSRFT
jgi:hypothetical protein